MNEIQQAANVVQFWINGGRGKQRVTLAVAKRLMMRNGTGTVIVNGRVIPIQQKRVMAGVYEVWIDEPKGSQG
jgi:hypothetical protein